MGSAESHPVGNITQLTERLAVMLVLLEGLDRDVDNKDKLHLLRFAYDGPTDRGLNGGLVAKEAVSKTCCRHGFTAF